ncbi:MAG TPA: hypothetical protein VKE98_18790, partial [Gemmataceae bacterium]|nr:hypothetical protein [Gemmataceae bacterium]
AQFFRGERACHRLAAVRGFPFRLGDQGVFPLGAWQLAGCFPWGPRPRPGDPPYFGPRPDSVVVPLVFRWAAVLAKRLFCRFCRCSSKSSAGSPLRRFVSSTNPQAQRDGGHRDGHA